MKAILNFIAALMAFVSALIGATIIMFLMENKGHTVSGIVIGVLMAYPQLYIILSWMKDQEIAEQKERIAQCLK